MNISIITVGNKPTPELAEFINSYTQRLPRNITVNWNYLKHANFVNTNTSKQHESENILKHITKTDFVILLDETGSQISSNQLSEMIFAANNNVVFVVGGAYGVDDNVFARANFVWSLSKLVFPHQIVRLLLSEQIYRAYTISINHPYHHS
jgi:23S rRNA (pseudouridine1915-N3)-methyltransferase